MDRTGKKRMDPMRRQARALPALAVALVVVAACGEARAAAQPGIEALVREVVPQVIDLRHRIHQNPELGFREHETARLVAAHLEALGLDEIRTGVAGTGVTGLLRGGRPGPLVAVRADMDALPVTEATGFLFSSTKRDVYGGQEVGVAHACGHDVHTSILLGVASVLSRMRADLQGSVRFIFQPAEEGSPPGVTDAALQMMEAGVLEGPKPVAIFGLHAMPSLEVGQAGWSDGPAMAATDRFKITLRGRSSHGAAPDEGIDAVVMGAQAVMALQTIRSRSLPPLAPSVITVGVFRGGTRYNIIPGEVELEGTVRSYDEAIQAGIMDRMEKILSGIAESFGGSYEMDYVMVCPALVNDGPLTGLAVDTLRRTLGEARVVEIDPLMPGEDFAFFAREVPAFYFHLGVRAPGGTSGGLHTPDMRADDGALEPGMRALASLVMDRLAAGERL